MTLTLKDVLLKGQAAHQKIIPAGEVLEFHETSELSRLLLTYRVYAQMKQLGFRSILWILALVVLIPTAILDVVLLVLRYPLYPLFVLMSKLDRKLWFRTIHCPFCYIPINDRFVRCKRCGAVQGSMRPRDFETMYRACPRCNAGYMRLIGMYFWPPKAHAACRTTPTEWHGCNRQLPESVNWGRTSESHIAICGPSTSMKLAVLGLIWKHLVRGGSRRGGLAGRGSPASTQTEDEYDLLTSQLAEGSSLKDTASSVQYALGHSGIFLVRRWSGTRLLNFHNLPNGWTRVSDTEIAMRYIHIMYDRVILFVADLRSITVPSPNARQYARLIHIAEQLGGSKSWDRPFTGRIVVLVPWTEKTEVKDYESLVKERDPQFWALLQKTGGKKVRYLGGPLARDSTVPAWIARLTDRHLR